MIRKKSFKRITAALCSLILCTLCALPVYADTQTGSLESITVGIPADRCPMFYQDPDSGEILGIGVDLMKIAAENAGYHTDFVFIKEATLKDALDNTDYDVLMPFGSAVKSTSGQPSVISDNLFQTPFTLVTMNDKNISSFSNLRVGMIRSLGAGAETVNQRYPGIEINMYETMNESVNALRSGKIDGLLHNSYVWSYVLQKPSYSDLKVNPSSMFSMDFRIGTSDTAKGRELIQKLNTGIAELNDTNRQAVILDYTSRRLYKYDIWDYIHTYWLITLLLLLLFSTLVIISLQGKHSLKLEQEEKMRRLMDIDPLTGAYNMNGFRKKSEELLRAHPDVPYFLSYNNIINFKFINDSQGRAAGDELLKFWVDKSKSVMTEEEAIGRIDADHFAVLRRVESEENIRQDEQSVFEPLQNFFINKGKETKVQICSGVYVLTQEDFITIDIDHMLDLARDAEKRIRDKHKTGLEFYNPDQWKRGKRIADISSHLPTAIKNGEIRVWYQPQVNYNTSEITGAEALCRWNHSSLGWIEPGEFIPMLEDAGIIYELDCFVWETVCRDLKRWNEQGKHRRVSVNISRYDIREEPDLTQHFSELTERYGLTNDQLRIEITETAYVENPSLLIETTLKLKNLGFQVEMDDFGSGYSSLHMLKEVPVDRIKLDLYFLTETGDQEKGRTIVSSMIGMGHALGMELIAEGVETAKQADFLQSIGCFDMQGYYFYKPMPAPDFEKLGERFGVNGYS